MMNKGHLNYLSQANACRLRHVLALAILRGGVPQGRQPIHWKNLCREKSSIV